MKHIILLLGGPNDDKGNLSKIASDRVECAYHLYKNNDHVQVLATGGFGDHFNKTAMPHAYYTTQLLKQKGVNEHDILEYILSANSVEDFKISKPVIERERPDLLLLVTSDFHMERARILCNLILRYPDIVFIPARSSLSREELVPLVQHEKEAIMKLRNNNYVIY